jgi:branched-chain amino acid transport system permease protein
LAEAVLPQQSLKSYVDWKHLITIAAAIFLVVGTVVWLGPKAADTQPYRFVQTTVTGILTGGVYALVALGIVIINKASGVFNFAHGYLMLAGGLIFASFFGNANMGVPEVAVLNIITIAIVLTMNTWRDILNLRNVVIGVVAVVILTFLMTLSDNDFRMVRAITGGAVGSILLGLSVERLAIRPLIGQPLFTMVLMTLAVSEILHGVTQMIWGSVETPLRVFAGVEELGVCMPTCRIDLPEAVFDARPLIINTQLMIAFGLSLIAFAAFVAFFQYTSVGLSMRATAENQQLAQSVGLRVRVILASAWAIATLLAGPAGILQGAATSLSQNMPLLALSAFPAVLLGGLESIGGALVGGLIIGLSQEWANLLLPGTQAGTEFAPYAILMIVLIIRPDGLFGQKRIDRI